MKNKGFTLVEILIVVVILGILAAIVIPQFSDASTESKLSSSRSSLQSLRSQIQLFMIQHNDTPPALATFAVLIALKSRKTAFIVLVGGLALTPFLIPQLLADDTYSFSTRIAAWEIISEIAQVNPVFGVGPANYYRYTPLFSILGYSVNFSSHNQYVDLIAQTGIVGLVFFLWFFASMFIFGWKRKSKVPEGFPTAYTYGILGGILGTLAAGMLGDWILPFVYNIGFVGFRSSIFPWIFLGGMIAMVHILDQRNDSQAN